MELNRTQEPYVEPVYLQDAKSFLRIEHNDEDSEIWNLIVAARDACEQYTGRSLITQNWQVKYDHFPRFCDYMNLYKGPIQSITTLKEHDSAGNTNTISSDIYHLTSKHNNGRITLKYNQIWSTTVLQNRNGVEINYVAGYGDNPEDVPFMIRQGILAWVAHAYENREGDWQNEKVARQYWHQFKLHEF